jgi:hypothetical protein
MFLKNGPIMGILEINKGSFSENEDEDILMAAARVFIPRLI